SCPCQSCPERKPATASSTPPRNRMQPPSSFSLLLGLVFLESCVVVVAPLRPIIGRSGLTECDFSDAFEVLDAVFNRYNETQGSAMLRFERLAVHFIAEQRLRVKRRRHVQPDIIFAVGCFEC